jgi:hypothetical protein
MIPMPAPTHQDPPWDPAFPIRHCALARLHGDLTGLPPSWPDASALDALLEGEGGRPVTAGGVPVRAVPGISLGGAQWERRLCATGEIPVRQASWHDLFNLLSWRAFPRTKAAVNGAHVRALEQEAHARRGPRRDALASFDEDGLVVACEDVRLEALVRGFRWQELFVDRRHAVREGLHVFAFGHALCHKLLAPFKGVTGKALFVTVAPGFAGRSLAGQRQWVDELTAPLVASLAKPRDLAPLPVLGLPGWWPGNEDPRFYEDATVFRPGRRSGEAGQG